MTQILEPIIFSILLTLVVLSVYPLFVVPFESIVQGQSEQRLDSTLKIQNETSSKNMTQGSTNLTIFTTVENNCQPETRCDGIRAEDFQIGIYEFQDSKPNPLTLLKSFPGSTKGWLVSSLPPLTQYDVNTDASFAEYSSDCHGILYARHNKTCVVSVNVTDSGLRNRGNSDLTIFTTVENNCQPKTRCDGIRAEDFQIGIYEFQDSKPNPLTLLKSFPGSTKGWTLTSLSPYMQYDIKQWYRGTLNNAVVNMSYSPGCHGLIETGKITCSIDSELSTVIAMNETNLRTLDQ